MRFYIIRVNGQEYRIGVEKIEDGVYRVKLGEKEAEVFVEETYEGYEAKKVESVESPVRVLEKPVTKAPTNAITSMLPGVVVKILVKPGDRVKVGEPIMIVESMKMENEIVSHVDGTIREIRVREGQRIEAGEVLAVIQ